MSQHTTQLSIAGMSCRSCASTIEEHLDNVAGVADVTVNFSTERETVRHEPDVSAEQFTNAAESAGYEAREEVSPQ